MQAASVDFNAEEFLQPDITEMDVPAKMIQQGKLARFVWGFEHDGVEPERLDKPVRVCGIQLSFLIEQSDAQCTFPGFDDELERTGIEPFLPLVNPRRKRPVVEPPVMLLSQLHLNVETAALCGGDGLTGIEMALGETLTAFDSSNSDVRAQIQVCRQFSLGHGNFKRPSAGHGGDSMRAGERDFHPGCAF